MPSFRRHREGGDLCAIFVHAGAGYHSHANETHHLAAVDDAAKVAMALLRNGGEATDAVEMAIKLLEDREITNAGYGSNLTLTGEVECDATLVDHYGRSGAVGAVSQVRNPIGLARLVLDESTKPLSLQRVPPNLLVGVGARDFAYDKGIPIMPEDFLVSSAARERWLRWRQDLHNAEMRDEEPGQVQVSPWGQQNTPQSIPTTFSPPTSPPQWNDDPPMRTQLPTPIRPLQNSTADVPTLSTFGKSSHSIGQSISPSVPPPYSPSPLNGGRAGWDIHPDPASDNISHLTAKRQRTDGSFDESDSDTDFSWPTLPQHEPLPRLPERDEDHITDTVGAIAVDCFGNIAAGSSSGGIGMKHRGRCGPAALVGIGTAVKPMDSKDPDRVCVATVTSGTGEHMATTMAAATAADRLFSSVRKDKHGGLKTCDDSEAMRAFIKEEFMKHPGVRNSHCAGAIGIMAVKKTKEGIYLYFGHNTDSFALASLHSDERKTTCVMSRSTGNGSIAQGGRAMHYRGRGKKA